MYNDENEKVSYMIRKTHKPNTVKNCNLTIISKHMTASFRKMLEFTFKSILYKL